MHAVDSSLHRAGWSLDAAPFKGLLFMATNRRRFMMFRGEPGGGAGCCEEPRSADPSARVRRQPQLSVHLMHPVPSEERCVRPAVRQPFPAP